MRAVVGEIERLVSRAGDHPVWGYAHCLRVHALAVELAEAEGLGYDAEALRLAALLHDIGLYRAYRLREGADHVRRSKAVATRMLRDGDLPPSAIRLVLDAIEHHPRARPRAARRRPCSSRTPSPSIIWAPWASRACSRWSASKKTSPTCPPP